MKLAHRNGRKASSGRSSRRNGVIQARTHRSLVVKVRSERPGVRKSRKSRPMARARRRRSVQQPKLAARLSRRNGKNGAHRKIRTSNRSIVLANGQGKDRIMLMARDSFWLHAYWQISLSSVQRAEAALREDWHGAKPVLRIFDVSSEDTTSSSERHVRDIDIHGTVNNWYIDVSKPGHSYRVDIGYLSRRGRFYALAHSNVVMTPAVGASDVVDEHWSHVQQQFERIYANSGRPNQSNTSEPTHALEERLRRPLASAPWANLALGSIPAGRSRRFWFELDAELIVHGCTQPSSRVTLQGERVPLRPDGTFTMRFRLPDKRLIIPATAASPEGSEERTIVLAVERNTKELEPMVHENRCD